MLYVCGIPGDGCLFSLQAAGGRLVFDVDGKKVPVLATMQGGEWRTVRLAVTPAFSGYKMKMVSNSEKLGMGFILDFELGFGFRLDLEMGL